MTAKRLKEVGVRKVVGARRKQIVIQFLIETVLIIALAMMAGLAISQVIVPAFVTMWNLPYSMSDLSGLNLFITLLLLILLSSLLAGMYPALFNSRFKPVVMLKGNVSIRGTNVLTRILVTLQFALSVVVLIAGIVFTQNAHYQENFNFGYDPNMVITVGVQSEEEFKTMKDRIESNPKILAVSACGHHIGYSTYQFPIKVDTAEYVSHLLGVGKGYFRTMGFDLLDGRDIDPENTSDLEEAVIVNKAFIQRAGIQDPLDKIITVHEARRHIVGVVENHVDNLYRTKEPEPFVYYPSVPFAYRMLLVRVNPNDRVEVQRYLEKTWKELFPSTPFDSRFQEDIILAGTKQANANLKATFLFLTFLGGLLSASGIFSLASLNVVRRTKEIGIRKVLGASAKNILTLINREFIIILTIAGLIGGLGGFYLTRGLLDDMYAFHVSVGMFPIVLSAFSIFCVGIFTTSITILKAAGANPVETLKTE